MADTITMAKASFEKVLSDVEELVSDIEMLTSETVQKRLAEIKQNPALCKSEDELDAYLKKRGVKVGS